MNSHRYKTLIALISDMRLSLNNVEEVINAENKSNTAAKTVEPYIIQIWLPQTAGGWTRSMDLPSTYDNVADAQAAIDKHIEYLKHQTSLLEYRVAKESWPKDGPAPTVEPYIIQMWLPRTSGGWTRSMDLPSTYDNVADAKAAMDKHIKDSNILTTSDYRVAKESWSKDGPAPTAITESTGPYIVQVLLPSGDWLHSGCVPARFATAAQAQQAIEEATQRLPGAMLTLRVFNDETNSPVGETGETSAEPYIVQVSLPSGSWLHSAFAPDSYATAAQAQQAIEKARGMGPVGIKYRYRVFNEETGSPVGETGETSAEPYIVQAMFPGCSWVHSACVPDSYATAAQAQQAIEEARGTEPVGIKYRVFNEGTGSPVGETGETSANTQAPQLRKDTPVQQTGYVVEGQWYDETIWSPSGNIGLAGTLFSSEYAARAAYKVLGSENILYRAVRTTRPKPAQQWELRIQSRTLGWTRKSVRTALAGTLFDTEYAAIKAAEKLGASDVKYRAVLA